MRAIDEIEDRIAPIPAEIVRIRELISSLELCHHKAERWVDNTIEAIGTGVTAKGLGTRAPGHQSPAEDVWQSVCAALSAWCAERPATLVNRTVDTVPAHRLLESLGERSPLKEWQVQRVIERIRSLIHWERADDDSTTRYRWILLGGGEYQALFRDECPEYYQGQGEFWLTTVRTVIHDTVDGDDAGISLGTAIDMLWPCHWRFVGNLRIVLEAIDGNLHPDTPFAACGRNIALLPIRRRMEIVSNTLGAFCGDPEADHELDMEILAVLGEPTEEKKWLAASLNKTMRLQMNPPARLREVSALHGPDWIDEG
jgi:hypothetical protein